MTVRAVRSPIKAQLKSGRVGAGDECDHGIVTAISMTALPIHGTGKSVMRASIELASRVRGVGEANARFARWAISRHYFI
jgi:hypothetical protein